ncbi:Protein CBG11791 [Caenorhabditis briggsae]|uniref:Protein CBG11791 n=1 Tax=Caenorhabditis briggsae TaxID=6238 RepID=A8XE22_CAEBR|nr:Protein CBG11791 [Caenorhabditis briggsae]CAP30892.1 Protein CBG11791 [Caenorhabditis briggsae]
MSRMRVHAGGKSDCVGNHWKKLCRSDEWGNCLCVRGGIAYVWISMMPPLKTFSWSKSRRSPNSLARSSENKHSLIGKSSIRRSLKFSYATTKEFLSSKRRKKKKQAELDKTNKGHESSFSR